MKFWDNEEEELLRYWYLEENWTYEEIATELGRSICAVQHKSSKLKLTNKKYYWNKDEEEELKILCKGGLSYREIGAKLNKTKDSVQKKAVKMHYSINKEYVKRTHQEYIAELAEKCPTLKCIEAYVNSHTKILHECLLCGMQYKCRPNNKLNNHSCRYCSGIELLKPAIVYLVYFYEINIIKPGITSKSTKIRNDKHGLKYEIILERYFNTGLEAIQLEQYWIENTKHLHINTGLLKSGNTETFRYTI